MVKVATTFVFWPKVLHRSNRSYLLDQDLYLNSVSYLREVYLKNYFRFDNQKKSRERGGGGHNHYNIKHTSPKG